MLRQTHRSIQLEKYVTQSWRKPKCHAKFGMKGRVVGVRPKEVVCVWFNIDLLR